jgi:hypothetical protein
MMPRYPIVGLCWHDTFLRTGALPIKARPCPDGIAPNAFWFLSLFCQRPPRPFPALAFVFHRADNGQNGTRIAVGIADEYVWLVSVINRNFGV